MSGFSVAPMFAIACLLTSGCTQTAQITYWQPAELGPHEFRNIAVAHLDVACSHSFEMEFEKQIAKAENLNFVDTASFEPSIQQAMHAEGDTAEVERLLYFVQRKGIDAIIDGEVTEFDSTPPPVENGGKADSFRTIDQARISVTLRLIDSETGETLEERKISRDFDRQRQGVGRQFSSRYGVQTRLTRECVAEFMELLAPHEAHATIELAQGELFSLNGLDVQRGVKRAVDGDWEAAERIWRSVIEREPENDAALFNLAIAAANRQDYCAAEDYAMQAIRIRHTECYAAGQEQIRQFHSHESRIERNCDIPLTARLP